MARAKTGKSAIERAQKQEQVLQLRLAGASIRTIEKKTGIPKSTVQRLAEDAIAEIKREPAEMVIDMELQRLDAMLLGIWKEAVTGDHKSIDRALRIMERRAKYMNLDAAVAPDTSGEARQALGELMGAIRGSVIDRTDIAGSAVAPGAAPMSAGIAAPEQAPATEEPAQ